MVVVEVVGQGYVGLATSILAAVSGHQVIGIERDRGRRESLQAGVVPFVEPETAAWFARDEIRSRIKFVSGDRRDASSETSETLCLAVPAPTRVDGTVDTGNLVEALERHWDPDRHTTVAVRTTVLPGFLRSLVEGTRFSGLGQALVYWPEFLNQGRSVREVLHPDRTVVGLYDPGAEKVVADLMAGFGYSSERVHIRSLEEAECIKHFSNAALALNKVLGAEMSEHCRALDVDPRRVLASVAADARLSADLLHPHLPLVDSCLRKDLTALTGLLANRGGSGTLLRTGLKEADRLARQQLDMLAAHIAKEPTLTVGLVGAGFTQAVGDTTGSLATPIIDLCAELGADVLVWDPYAERKGALAGVDFLDDLDDLAVECGILAVLVEHPDVHQHDWGRTLDGIRRVRGALFDFCSCRVLDSLRQSRPSELHGLASTSWCPVCAD